MKIFLRQFYFELLKLVARKRTYAGFAVFLLVDVIFFSILSLPSTRHRFTEMFARGGHAFDHYDTGLTLAHIVLDFSVFFLGTLFLALISGDMIAKEVEDGTLRMVLSRPVSRLRILLVKYLACVAYTVVLMLFIVVTCLAAGIADRGIGAMAIFSGGGGGPGRMMSFAFYETPEALTRFAWATLVLCLSAPTISSVGFMFSCFRLKPATATILTLSFFFMDTVLRQVPFFSHLKNIFLTQHISIWTHLFDYQFSWVHVLKTLLLLGACDVVFFAIGAAYFCRRDFKS
jgi:ABC-2 type transport system permease protein